MKRKILQNIGLLILMFCMCITLFGGNIIANVDNEAPVINIGRPSSSSIYEGENVTYIVTATDNVRTVAFGISKSSIVLNGFTADIKIDKTDSFEMVITFFNVKSTSNSKKTFVIKGGAALDEFGNYSTQTVSSSFSIETRPVESPKTPAETPVIPEAAVDKTDSILPVVKISTAKPSSIYNGATVSYKVTFSDNIGVTFVSLKASNIKLHGFSADIYITGTGTKTRTITLNNIKGTIGVKKYITIAASVATDKTGNRSKAVNSSKFAILKENVVVVPSKPIVQTPQATAVTVKCIDDFKLLGSVNAELNEFTAWLKSEKIDTTYAQENNRVAEDEKMTYYIEYYNANTSAVKNASFQLVIPYKVAVEEISEGGTFSSKDNSTIIEWKLTEIQPKAACRLYVNVKFAENSKLKLSTNISEQFYVSLKSNVDGKEAYSYLRQLFVDTTEGKIGKYSSYLANLDATNRIRPNDEVTRAEFAKMLADSGVVKVNADSEEYKSFKDYEKIPSYARTAVSALKKTNILHTFSDGEFKPNNPILIEDAIEMIAKASSYVSENKLIVNKPVFLYTDSLVDSEKEISPKKDYVMELIRQNVITKYEFVSDKYMLRREAVDIINSLMFRGPYVDKTVDSIIVYNDLRPKTPYYYNMIGATNSYNFSYNYKLWEEIVEINN